MGIQLPALSQNGPTKLVVQNIGGQSSNSIFCLCHERNFENFNFSTIYYFLLSCTIQQLKVVLVQLSVQMTIHRVYIFKVMQLLPNVRQLAASKLPLISGLGTLKYLPCRIHSKFKFQFWYSNESVYNFDHCQKNIT